MTLRRALLALLLAVGIIVAGATAAGAAPGAVGPDCKGDPPIPNSPYGFLVAKPTNTSTGDPFATPDTVSIQSTYGTNFRWWVYDTGCGAGSDVLPKLGSQMGQLVGLELPGLVPSWGTSLMSAVVNPTWTASLDTFVADATRATRDGVWLVWLVLVFTLVGVQVLARAIKGSLGKAITGTVWAIVVLTVVTAAINYPVESTHLLDSGIQTAVTETAEGFSDGRPAVAGATSGERAQAALDHQWDVLTRATLYRSWLQGAFGSADSHSAQTLGAELFKSTHFSWSEWDVYSADPNGAGKVIIDDKAGHFREVADRLKESDPVAYEHFTGNDYADRIGVGFLSLIEILIVAWFLLAAAIVILISYLLVRLLVPVMPAAGVFFVIDSFRDTAISWLRKVAGLFVMGPLYFIAALIVGRFNTAVLSTDLNPVLKLIFIGAIAVVAWRLLQPKTMLGQHLKIPTVAAVTSYVAGRHGGPQDAPKPQDVPKPQKPQDAPVRHADGQPDDAVHIAPSASSRRPRPAQEPSRPVATSRPKQERSVVYGPVEVYNPRRSSRPENGASHG